ncbi:hypothetical protein Taro_010013 [Colocasia esculenta]|uniref:Uncharacterized protein n=1 Tax=Colocasia esculenta TaxID=4460 RepID=A0A843U6I6_COLES|nr:hypothetical protein [Colocasia esculenta]
MDVPKEGTRALLARLCRVLLGEHMVLCCRLSRPVLLSRQEYCRDAFPWRDLLVAVALPVAMGSRRARRARQDLVFLGCFRGHGWHVGVCPRAGCALRTIWWECDRLPPGVH